MFDDEIGLVAGFALALPGKQHIAKTSGGEKASQAGLLRQQGVRCDRRPVLYGLNSLKQRARIEPEILGDQRESLKRKPSEGSCGVVPTL